MGTNAPEQKLHLRVSENTGQSFPLLIQNNTAQNSGGTGSGIGFSNMGSSAVKTAIYNERTADFSLGKLHFLMSSSGNTNAVDLSTDARMTILSSGNVGVGTTSPSNKLHVEGGIRMVDGNQAAGYIPVSDANGNMSWTDPTFITTAADGDGSSTNELQTISISGNDITLSNSGGTVSVPNDGDWTINGNNQYSAVSGNVGVGTATPQAKLEVKAEEMILRRNATFEGTTFTLIGHRHNGTTGWNGYAGSDGIGSIDFRNLDASGFNSEYVSAKIQSTNGGASDDGDLRFYTSNTQSLAERMRIDHFGNVGIGTTPTEKLHISGSIRMVDGNQAVGYIPVSDANGEMTWTDPTTITTAADGDGSSTNELQTLSLSGNTLVISSGNNVSLAGFVNTDNQNLSSTTSGTNRTINISGGTGTTISVADNDNSASNELQTLSISGSDITLSNGGGTVSVPNDGDWTTAGTDIYNANTGNVGIDVTNPTNRLTIGGSNSDAYPALGLRSGNNGLGFNDGPQIAFGFNGTESYQHFIQTRHNSGAANNAIDFYVSNGTQNNTLTSGSTHVMSLNGGNVGVGTTSPTNKLHVEGAIRMVDGNQAAGYIPVSDANGNMTWTDPTTVNTADDGDWVVGFGNAYRTSGKVGVGTYPSVPLDVEGGASGSHLASENYVMNIENTWTDPTNLMQYNGLYIRAGKENNNGANSRMVGFSRPGNAIIGGIVQNNANSVSYNTTSDERLKTNIQPSAYGLADLMAINVVDYVYKDEMDDPQNGFITQQLYEVYPFPVIPGGEDVSQDPWTMDYGKLSPLLVKAVQDLKAEKDELEAQVQQLMQRVEQLEKQ